MDNKFFENYMIIFMEVELANIIDSYSLINTYVSLKQNKFLD